MHTFEMFPGEFASWMMIREGLLSLRLREQFHDVAEPQPGYLDRMLLVQLRAAIGKGFVDYLVNERKLASEKFSRKLHNLKQLYGDIIAHHIHER
jgi:hypothetical protein